MFRARSGALGAFLEDLGRGPARVREERATSLLHLCANRLLRSGHRLQEAVLYDFLHRLYRTEAAVAGTGTSGGAGRISSA